jgi:hypothetical protein
VKGEGDGEEYEEDDQEHVDNQNSQSDHHSPGQEQYQEQLDSEQLRNAERMFAEHDQNNSHLHHPMMHPM